MAVIKTIRNYSGIAIFFIAISILAFIAADLFIPKQGAQQIIIGSINGVDIQKSEFDTELKKLEFNYRLNNPDGGSINDQLRQSFREQAWTNLIFKYAYREHFENLGVAVTPEELTDLVQGDSLFIHPWIRQQFTNQETQVFDKQLVIRYLNQLSQMPPQQQASWENFENELKKERLRSKYVDLMRLSSYATKAEAERQYQNQTAKVNVKFLYVPYTSLVDSLYTEKVTDALLKAKLREKGDMYKAEETRSIDYVAFDIAPSKEDSTIFLEDLEQLAKDFEKAPSDSSFANLNSDIPQPFAFQPLNQVPTVIFDNNDVIEKGKVYGPYLDNDTYKIFKVADVKEDTMQYARARHILFSANKDASDTEKEEARKKANEVLQEIKNGADFAEMAKKYGSDGTAQKGGDLGFFANNGTMVAPFQDAVFSRSEKGLVPELVETDFGYHILGVTYPKTNKTYKIATVTRTLDPSEDTRNEILLQAEELKSKCSTLEDLKIEVGKIPALTVESAEKLATTATSIGAIQGAREIIRWAFNDAAIGKITDEDQVFEISDQNKFIIAVVTGKTAKDESTIDIFRTELEQEVLKDLKAEEISAKIDLNAKTLEDMAKSYGDAAQVNTANDVTFSSSVLQGAGFSPQSIGQAFGLNKEQRSKIIRDDSGIFILEVIDITAAPEIADYTQYKTQLEQSAGQRVQFMVDQAIREAAGIEDERYKYY